jgi:autotransporter-associated beta strand protein
VDKGANIGDPFYGSAPDLGAYESAVLTWRGDGVSNIWNSGVSTNWFDGQRLVVFINAAFVTFDNSGSNSPSINLVGSLSPFLVTVTSTQNYTFGGTGSLDGLMMSLVKSGTGQLTVTTSNTFGGGTTVSNGTLLVNNMAGSGTGTGAVTVVSGATLGGSGTIRGPVTVNGTLSPGDGVGTLTISNILVVNSGAVLQYVLGTNSDLTAVSSNLTLGGTLNITNAGGFTTTTYRLFNYGGTLTYSGLTVGTKPNSNFIYTVSTSTVGQVNLIVSNSAASLVASFSGSPTNGTAPLAVTFTDNSTGTITSNFWDFGDGSTTNFTVPTNVAHTYSVVGVYSVTLIASGSGSVSTNTQVNLITVLDPFTAWQLQYFGCTNCPQADADADPLGKGMSNTNQFLAGINPTNNLSALRIISVVPQSNNLVITWTTAGGYTNAVQATSGDGSGGYSTNFVDISAPIILPGNGDATTNYVDVGGATNVPSRYYRVRLFP